MQTDQIRLSINYRSQNSILTVANNIVKLLETIFPNSVDRMNEEVSEQSGPKPFILDPMGDELLCHYLFGRTREQAVQLAMDQSEDFEFEVLSDEEGHEECKEEKQEGKNKVPTAPGKPGQAPHFGAS